MSELEDKINSILSNPEELEKITNIAKSIMGGEAGDAAPSADGAASGGFDLSSLGLGSLGLGSSDSGGLDPNMIAALGRLMSRAGVGSENHALLEAMKPYLNHRRREKMERAMQIARMARIAGAAFTEFGGGGNE